MSLYISWAVNLRVVFVTFIESKCSFMMMNFTKENEVKGD